MSSGTISTFIVMANTNDGTNSIGVTVIGFASSTLLFTRPWVNQVEIFFGIVQKRVLRYGVFNSARELEGALRRFIRHWNHHEAHPFRWTFKGYPLQSTSTAA